jgi:N-acyl-phosphatidylethanolamine-hydrolysing phospholipase D
MNVNASEFIRTDQNLISITWLGHSSMLLKVNGFNILTDPVFAERASPFPFLGPKRLTPVPFDFESLPVIDVVLISHNHYDHLDAPGVKKLAAMYQKFQKPLFIVPEGLKIWFRKKGIFQVEELAWWESVRHQDLTVHSVPARHFSSRFILDTNFTKWCGFIAEIGNFKFFFAGDTGYSKEFKNIGLKYGPIDLAAIPIGAYSPRWFMQSKHVNPEEAVKIHQDVLSKKSVAMHWGTFKLTLEPVHEPPEKLAKARDAAGLLCEDFMVLKQAESLFFVPEKGIWRILT